MSCSAVYILELNGRVIISRNYRDDIDDRSVIEKFMPLLLEQEEENATNKPIVEGPDCIYAFIKKNNLYLVATMSRQKNCNVMLVFVFLHKIVKVLTQYFKEMNQESIRDNFVIVYELLDEVMDFGYPQTTDSKILKEYITQEVHELEIQPRVPAAVTNAVSWRSPGIQYNNNEVFLDVVESVDLLANANGHVVSCEIVGVLKMRAFLSGMPELKLGLNDKLACEESAHCVELENVKFHQCVRLSHFENARIISFIPPDDQFELMSYRLSTTKRPLISIQSIIERYPHSRVEYIIKAISQFKHSSIANNVKIIIPTPEFADTPKIHVSIGKCIFVPDRNAFIWTIKAFPGGKEHTLQAQIQLPSIDGDEDHNESKVPIHVHFEIPYYATSGVQVRFLKVVEKSGYHAMPWVRYITQSGNYQVRTN